MFILLNWLKEKKLDIHFSYNLPDDDIIVQSDPLRLKQVLIKFAQ